METLTSLKNTLEEVETALRFAVADYRKKGGEPSVVFIREGPYAIPFPAAEKATAR